MRIFCILSDINLSLTGVGELLVDSGWCGCQPEVVGHIWRPSQGSQVATNPDKAKLPASELASIGLPMVALMWSSCVLTSAEPSPSKTAGGGFDRNERTKHYTLKHGYERAKHFKF